MTISGIIFLVVAILGAFGVIGKDEKKELNRMSIDEEKSFDLMN